ncbi:MAG: hypothetical protein LBJ32_02070 [Oscillospiraceae bacterium]|nr:hypothetical protein [Oscillospiraceae bacterium]
MSKRPVLNSVKKLKEVIRTIDKSSKSILKIQNLFKVNKFFQKTLATSLAALFTISIMKSESLIKVNALQITDTGKNRRNNGKF